MLPSRRHNQVWMPGIFNDLFENAWPAKNGMSVPAINVFENDKGYDLELAAPGMSKEDFNVSLDADGDLVISMEKKNENAEKAENGRYLRKEFSYGKYRQTMLLPEDAEKDAISAKVENGVLKVNIPKVAKAAEADSCKVIEIQ